MGFWLWAGKVTGLDLSSQQWYIALAGAGIGLMLGQAPSSAGQVRHRIVFGVESST